MNNLSNISTLKNILSKYDINLSKSLGQNFLINPHVCPEMAENCGASSGSGTLEIGPGIGVLTYELAKRSKKVVAIEIDKKLLPILDATLKEFNNIKIINDDILKVDIKKIIENEFCGMPVVICANLPYYITSPVIMKILEGNFNIESLTVMVQKEVADRICAKPGSKESGAISLAVNYYAKPEILFQVSKESFMPVPKVDSTVIKLNILKSPPILVKDKKFLFKVIKAGFSQRRKTIQNSLCSALGIEKSLISKILFDCNINLLSRAEQLTLQDFSILSDKIIENIGTKKLD